MGEPAEDLYVPEPGKVAIRDLDGTVSKIAQADLPAAQGEGARPATEAEYFGAKTGLAGQLASGAIGLGRGASFGLSDAAFIEGSRLIGGDAEAEDTRHALNLAKRVNPNATMAGEFAGAIAPAFFGAPAAGGALALGESAAARFGARALAAAPRALGEGVGMGLGAQFSEDTLENHKLAGEAYLSAGLKGGTIGLLLGAGGAGLLGHAGDKVSSLFGKGARAEESAGLRAVEEAGPYRTAGRVEEAAAEQGGRKGILERLDELSDQLTYKSTGANRTDVARLGKTADAQAERMGSIADRLRNETFESKPLVEALAGEKEINRRIVGRANEVGKELGAMRRTLDTAAERPSLGAIADRFETEVAGPAAELAGGERGIRGADRFLRDMQKKGGDAPSFDWLYKQRRQLDELRYDIGIPKAERRAYDALRGIVEDEFTTAGERAAKEIGGTFADNYRLQKALYSDLAAAKEASGRAVGRGTGNNAISLTDYAAAGIGAVAGGPAGLLAAGLNMVKRNYGTQIAAHVLDTATRMQSVQRAATKLDDMLSQGTKAFVSGGKAAGRPARVASSEEIRALREATRAPEAVTARVADALGDMPAVAPKVAQEAAMVATRAAAWAQHALPKDTAPIGPMFTKPKPTPISDGDRIKATATIEGIEGGEVIVDRLRQGRLTPEHIAAFQYVHPESYGKFRTYLAQHATELGKDLNQQQLTKLGTLFGEPLTEQVLPENRRAFQASFTQGNQAPGQGGAGGNTGGAAMRAKPIQGGGNGATAFDRVEAGK